MNVEVAGEKYFTVIRPVAQLLQENERGREWVGGETAERTRPCRPEEVTPTP